MKNIISHTFLTVSIAILLQLLSLHKVQANERVLYLFKPASIHEVHSSSALPSTYATLHINKTFMDTLSYHSITTCTIKQFPLPDGKKVDLILERFDILSTEGYIVEGTAEGDKLLNIPKYLAFRGKIKGYEQSHVFISVFESYCIGSVEYTDRNGIMNRFTIKPDDVNNSIPITIIGDFSSISLKNHYSCGAEDLPDYQKKFEELLNDMRYYYSTKKEDHTLEAEKHSIHVAVECDYRFFKTNNTTVALSANYAIALLGAVSAIYERDVSVKLRINYLRIWTTFSPYPSITKNDILEQFRTYWNDNMAHIKRSVALLLTDNSIQGGIAFIKSLCNTEDAYAVSGLNGYFSLPSFDYTWDIDVTAHELGHVFGSAHTHECLWEPPIDSCAFPTGNCIKQTRASKGTIMSYCHLNGSIELRLHPRVATLMRFHISNTECISREEKTFTNNIMAIDFSLPANGGYYENNKPIPIKGFIKNCGKTNLQNIIVTCTLKKFNQEVILIQSRVVESLSSLSVGEIIFDNLFISDNGIYQIELSVSHALDEDNNNNIIIRPLEIGAPITGKSITLTYPSGGEQFQAGEVITIKWTQKGLAQIVIDYSSDGGITWHNAVFNTGAPNGSCSWKIPPINSNNVLLRVKDIFYSFAYDIIKVPFSIITVNDIEALELGNPISNSEVSGSISPVIVFRNNGTIVQNNVPVKLRVVWRNTGMEIYNRTEIIHTIASDSTVFVSFPEINPLPSGNYIFSTRCFLSGDKKPDNDSLGRIVNIKGYSQPLPIGAEPADKSAILMWKVNKGKNKPDFSLYRGDEQGTLLKIKEFKNTVSGFIDTELINGKEYYYALIAESIAPETIFVQGIRVIPQTSTEEMPDTPTLISPIHNSEKNSLPIIFQWSSIMNALYYEVQISVDKDFSNIISDIILKENTIDRIETALNSHYFWRVRSINKTGNSPWSEIRSFTTVQQCATFCYSGNMNTSYASAPNLVWNSKEVTVEFWNYFESKNIKDAWAFTCGDVNDDMNGYFRASVPHSDGFLYWDYGYTDFGSRIAIPYMDYADKWTHIALTADGDSMRVYLDGDLVESIYSITYPGNLKGFILGAAYISNNIPDFVHNAKIDEFRIWNKARNHEEIKTTIHSSIPISENLVAYWRFDEMSGTLVYDKSGNNHNLLLQNEKYITSSDAPIMCTDAVSGLQSGSTEVYRNETIHINPNPAYNTITISTDADTDIFYSIEIYTYTGEKITSLSYDNTTHQRMFTVRIDSLKNGLYNCLLHSKSGVLQSSFIVVR